jgi:4-hydroxy-4-methyl-2-oxoglutarate aldolase
MADEISRRLAKLDVCALSDALDQLGLPSAVTGIAPRTVRRRVSGRAMTVKLAAGKSTSGPPRHLCTLAIDSAAPGDVIVVEQTTGIDAAGWGGILSNAAKQKGLAGAIIDGPARDIDEAADLDFPVYARSATARTARGRIHEIASGEPILVGGVTLAAGDYVAADSSGMVCIAADKIAVVLDAAERIAAREAVMTKDVLAGSPVSKVMGASYEHMLQSAPPKGE